MDILKIALAALLAERSVGDEESSKVSEKTSQDK